MKFILVTGMSGAGKTVALKTLEDCGFEAIDNIPLSFIPDVAASQARLRNLAVGSDIRSRDFSIEHFVEVMEMLKQNKDLEIKMLFLDCDDEVLRRRFTETRRRHPLAEDRAVIDGIAMERELVGGLRRLADLVIDTTDYKSGELRQVVAAHIAREDRKMSVALSSFSFKHGLPRDADMVFDVRFLTNPHYDPELQPLTGLDEAVGKRIETDPNFAAFFDRLIGLIKPLLPRYVEEGKNYLTIAIGCTGGKHRSVYVTQKLGHMLQMHGYNVTIRHRDLT
ncbi:MAG: RNase adapter RapZ [Rickettsiales bacterium]|nr:RNase adapter RapZ [Rickettsiales bacterium]